MTETLMLKPNGQCSGCNAPVHWVVTTTGRAMPIDLTPRPDGNIEFTGNQVRTHRGARSEVVVLSAALPGVTDDRYVSHFSTCPDADRFRRQQGSRRR